MLIKTWEAIDVDGVDRLDVKIQLHQLKDWHRTKKQRVPTNVLQVITLTTELVESPERAEHGRSQIMRLISVSAWQKRYRKRSKKQKTLERSGRSWQTIKMKWSWHMRKWMIMYKERAEEVFEWSLFEFESQKTLEHENDKQLAGWRWRQTSEAVRRVSTTMFWQRYVT